MLPVISSYVGLPFKLGGRDRNGADCWGLTRLVLMEVYGVTLPSFNVVDILDAQEVALLVDEFRPLLPIKEIPTPIEPSIVLMSYFGRSSHIGLYVGDDFVLHSDPMAKDLSKLDRLTSPRISARIAGYYSVLEG